MTVPNDVTTDDPRDDQDEVPGDTHAADIVSRTGEEMPIQRHAQVHSPVTPPARDDGNY